MSRGCRPHGRQGNMPRFVILDHDHPEPHYDLMLEFGAALRTWRLATPPRPGAPVPATALGAHRPFYLDYEGPVGGGRGRVLRWDAGRFELLEEGPRRLRLRMRGARLSGRLSLWQADAAS